jgi:hypothetical protein
VGWEDLTPSEAVASADWIGPRLHPFAQDVGSVIPPGFAAYARILHPAAGDPYPTEVRWSEVAAWNGKTIHPEVQFQPIAGENPASKFGPAPWRQDPLNGVLSNRQMKALVGLLATHTSTPDACWFCLWDGYGYLHPGGTASFVFVSAAGPRPLRWLRLRAARRRLRRKKPARQPAARVNLPSRSYLLFSGSVHQAVGWEDGPNLWWPDDRAWCVASEIDFGYTYVGGSHGLIKDVLAHPELEALPAELGDGVRYDSDKVNSTG